MLEWNRRGHSCCLETVETFGVVVAAAAVGLALEREGLRDNWRAFVAAALAAGSMSAAMEGLACSSAAAAGKN